MLITDNAAGSPQAIPLTGIGTAPLVSSPTSLNFGTVKLYTTSPSQTVTVKNSGTGLLTISKIALTGTNAICFTITAKTCGGSLAAEASCTVSVAFRPTVVVSQSANLTITDNAAWSPQAVGLSGQGVR